MSTRKAFPAFAALGCITALAITLILLPTTAVSASHRQVAPMLQRGPQAEFASVANPAAPAALFTCQIAGLSPNVTCYDPFQIRTAYGVDKLIAAGFDGHGKTIVIVDAFQSPLIVNELNTFNAFYGLPSMNGLGGPNNPNLGTFTQVAPDGLTPFIVGDANQAGWAEEITLDVLWAHAIAPGANITLVLAKSNNDDDILSATKFAVDHRLGDVISQSFGEAEACFDADLLAKQHEVFAEATRKNITLFASSGDQGAAQPSCDGNSLIKAVSTPASDPLVTAVGGTELHAARYCLTQVGCIPAANPAPGTYDSEIVWNEPNLGVEASGGGFSELFDKPHYQNEAISNEGRGEEKARGVPDIAYNAAVLHGVLTFLNIPGVTGPNGAFFLFGGTSAGSPQWAAITAILDQQAGRSLGFLNEGLYKIAHSPQRFATSFHDITVGDNSVDGIIGFPATPGWDASTGLGSPVQPHLNSLLLKFVSPEDGKHAIEDSANHHDNGKHGRGRMNEH